MMLFSSQTTFPFSICGGKKSGLAMQDFFRGIETGATCPPTLQQITKSYNNSVSRKRSIYSNRTVTLHKILHVKKQQ